LGVAARLPGTEVLVFSFYFNGKIYFLTGRAKKNKIFTVFKAILRKK